MRISLHLILSLLAQAIGFLGSTGFIMLRMNRIEASGVNPYIVLFGCASVGFMIPRLAFQFLIPAKCPDCGGSAKFKGGKPIKYICNQCGKTHKTTISEGKIY